MGMSDQNFLGCWNSNCYISKAVGKVGWTDEPAGFREADNDHLDGCQGAGGGQVSYEIDRKVRPQTQKVW